MRRTRLAVSVVAAAIAGALTGTLVARGHSAQRQVGPPAMRDSSAPVEPLDMGTGEDVLLVVGGTFASRAAADAANAALPFGDVQGFYVARTRQFDGLRAALGSAARDYVLVSAFRTEEGAQAFLDLARAVGAGAFVTGRVRNSGAEYVGLGQEPAPDGSGPLVSP